MSEPADRPPREPPPDDVPRLPRGRGLRLSGPQLFRIVATLALLVFVIVAQKPCAHSVSKLVTGFGSAGSAATMPTPGTIDVPTGSAGSNSLEGYERLRPGMTDEQVKAVIERARARAAGSAVSDAPAGQGGGSAGAGSAR